MLKRISIIFFVFFLCISFLKADCFLRKDSSGGFLVPFSIKNLTTAIPDIGNTNDREALIDSLTLFADNLGKRLNGTILIARHDTILVEKAYGYLHLYRSHDGYGWMPASELEKRRLQPSNAMTSNSIFELASVSKQFTAAAILKLCSEERMSLSDTLGQYFPGIPYKEVTVRQLLTHTSGLPEYFNFEYKIYDTATFITNDDLVRILVKTKPQRMFLSGQGYKYCNTNYALLASIVSIVSGESFEQYVRDHLWKPAGMKNTFFFTELVGLYPGGEQPECAVRKGQDYVNVKPLEGVTTLPLTRGHWRTGNLALYDRLNGIIGDKGVFTNAEDLVRWANVYFMEYQILTKDWIDEATRCQNKLPNGTVPRDMYGYGVHLEESPEHGFIVYHGGLWNGYHNLWAYRPSDGLIIIFLSNLYNSSHSGQSNELLNIYDRQSL